MANSMNRRTWLKTGSLITGSFTFLPGSMASLLAAAAPKVRSPRVITDVEFGDTVRTPLKARLFANENPFGPSEKAKKAIIESLTNCYQYPIDSIDELAGKITAYEGLGKDMVMLGAGSTPLLYAAALYFAKDGGSIVTGHPSYEDLPSHAEELKGKWVKVPLTSEYKLDLDAMEKAVDANTKLVYICNPNNPTATVLDTAKLKDFCERVSKKATVFVDEAYIDYLPNPQASSMIDCVKKGQNVIVARTFSKLYGFAGLRVGYIIAQPDMLKKLDPYSTKFMCLSATSVSAALASYQDKEFLQGALQKTMVSKDYLYKTLKQEGYEYIPSSANFVMFPIKMDGERFANEMMKRGVGVRFWKFNNKDWCRISIGRLDEMQAFESAFKEVS
jgi:histidinol-phosphate aminotransferase